jgi:hypothetical protein
MKNILFERAGVPNFASDLMVSGYTAIARNNARLIQTPNMFLANCSNVDS